MPKRGHERNRTNYKHKAELIRNILKLDHQSGKSNPHPQKDRKDKPKTKQKKKKKKKKQHQTNKQ